MACGLDERLLSDNNGMREEDGRVWDALGSGHINRIAGRGGSSGSLGQFVLRALWPHRTINASVWARNFRS